MMGTPLLRLMQDGVHGRAAQAGRREASRWRGLRQQGALPLSSS
jgi:hypothetical protein